MAKKKRGPRPGKHKRMPGELTNLRVYPETLQILNYLRETTDEFMCDLVHEMCVAYTVGHKLEEPIAKLIAFTEATERTRELTNIWRGEFVELIAERAKQLLEENSSLT